MRLVLALFSCLLSISVMAQDSLLRGDTIRGISVRGHRLRTFLLDAPNGISRIDLRMMDDMPRILGNADPMHYAQLLPGIQTNSEYDAGLHVQGCDNAHNIISVNGVPLYNVSHLLGFFSVFNTPHFATMQLGRSAANAAMDNRLGAHVNMLMADSLRRTTSGDVSIGPISSQGTLRLPVGQHSLLTISARQAYLNLLYSQWMKIETEVMRYNFGDYNLSWLWQPNERHAISVDFYHGYDRATYSDDDYLLDTGLKWGNTMAALHVNSLLGHDSQLRQTLYYTHSYNTFALNMSSLQVDVPSSISDVGYRADLKSGALSTGLQVVGHTIQPQDHRRSCVCRLYSANRPRCHHGRSAHRLLSVWRLSQGGVRPRCLRHLSAECYKPACSVQQLETPVFAPFRLFRHGPAYRVLVLSQPAIPWTICLERFFGFRHMDDESHVSLHR